MACALIGGLIADDFQAGNIRVADNNPESCARVRSQFGVNAMDNNTECAKGADVIVLAVKPQVLKDVAHELAPVVQEGSALVISIAAGIREADIQRWLGGEVAVVRTMPNTPALVQSGATGMFAGAKVSDEQRNLAESILRAVGLTLWVDEENLIDAVTAVSGSGPAYFFLVMEAMEAAARDLGLNEDTARLLTLQTALGASRMAMESDSDPATLRVNVTSPGGTTEKALGVLEDNGLREHFKAALTAARDRAGELSELLGKD